MLVQLQEIEHFHPPIAIFSAHNFARGQSHVPRFACSPRRSPRVFAVFLPCFSRVLRLLSARPPRILRASSARPPRVLRPDCACSSHDHPLFARFASGISASISSALHRVPRPYEIARSRTQSHALIRNRMRPRDMHAAAWSRVRRRGAPRAPWPRSIRFATRSTSAFATSALTSSALTTSATSAARRPPHDSPLGVPGARVARVPSRATIATSRCRAPVVVARQSRPVRCISLTRTPRRRAALAFPRAHVGTSHTSLISRPCSRRTMLCSTPHARSDEPSSPRTRPRVDRIRRLLSDPVPFAPMASRGDPS